MSKGNDTGNISLGSNKPEYKINDISKINSIGGRADYSSIAASGLTKGSAPSPNVLTGNAARGFNAAENDTTQGHAATGFPRRPGSIANSGRPLVNKSSQLMSRSAIGGIFRGGETIRVFKEKRLMDGFKPLKGVPGITAAAADKLSESEDLGLEGIGNTYKGAGILKRSAQGSYKIFRPGKKGKPPVSSYRGHSSSRAPSSPSSSSHAPSSAASSSRAPSSAASSSRAPSSAASSSPSAHSSSSSRPPLPPGKSSRPKKSGGTGKKQNPFKKRKPDKRLNSVWRKHRIKASRAIHSNGGSAFSAVTKFFAKMAIKFAAPLILVVLAISTLFGSLMTPIMALTSFFSGEFSLRSGDSLDLHNIGDLLLEDSFDSHGNALPGIRTFVAEYISGLSAYLSGQKASYHEVRLYTSRSSGPVSQTAPGMTAAFPDPADLVDAIKYVIAAFMIVQYDSALDKDEFIKLASGMFESLISRSETSFLEYCGEPTSFETPSGVSNKCLCGSVHSLPGCPDPVFAVHSSLTCEGCCGEKEIVEIIKCKDHDPLRKPECSADKCSTKKVTTEFYCDGTYYCNGHKILEVHIGFMKIGSLINSYFLAPIRDLENKVALSDEEYSQLALLYDGYDILIMLLEDAGISFSFGGEAGEAIARAALELSHHDRAQCNAASSWFSSATTAYLQAHQLVWPGDNHANSCCRGVTVSVKYSGADVNISTAGGINNIVTGWFLRDGTPWEEIYVSGSADLLPGDILMKHNSPDGSMNHGMVFTGTELMEEYFPGYGSRGFNMAHASYHTRGLAIDNAINPSGYSRYGFAPAGCVRVFRCTSEEVSTVYSDQPLPPANVSQCMRCG